MISPLRSKIDGSKEAELSIDVSNGVPPQLRQLVEIASPEPVPEERLGVPVMVVIVVPGLKSRPLETEGFVEESMRIGDAVSIEVPTVLVTMFGDVTKGV